MNTASVQDRSSASLWVYAGLAVVATAGFFYVNIMAAIVDCLPPEARVRHTPTEEELRATFPPGYQGDPNAEVNRRPGTDT